MHKNKPGIDARLVLLFFAGRRVFAFMLLLFILKVFV